MTKKASDEQIRLLRQKVRGLLAYGSVDTNIFAIALAAVLDQLERQNAELEQYRWRPINTAPKEGYIATLSTDDITCDPLATGDIWAAEAFHHALKKTASYEHLYGEAITCTHWMLLRYLDATPIYCGCGGKIVEVTE